MKQYCRYCIHAVDGDIDTSFVCTGKKYDPCYNSSKAKTVNHCKMFEFTPIDLFTGLEYKPREEKPKEDMLPGQMTLDDLGGMKIWGLEKL